MFLSWAEEVGKTLDFLNKERKHNAIAAQQDIERRSLVSFLYNTTRAAQATKALIVKGYLQEFS